MARKNKSSRRPKQQPKPLKKRDMLEFCEELQDDILEISSDQAAQIRQERLEQLTKEELREYDKLTRPGGSRFPLDMMVRDKLAPSQEERSRQKRYMRAFCKKLWAGMQKMPSARKANELRSIRLDQLSSQELQDYFDIEKARDKLLSFHIELAL